MERRVEIDEITSIEDIRAELAELNALHDRIGQRVEQAATPTTDANGIELSHANIVSKIDDLAGQIITAYLGRSRPLLISLLDGALPFASRLQESLAICGFAFDYSTMRTRSYDGDKAGKLEIISSSKEEVGARDVIILDDVWDTGNTFAGVKDLLENEYGANSVDLAVMVNKVQSRESLPNNLFSCFEIDKNSFIIGFGLDYSGKCRNMLDVKVVNFDSLMTEEESALIARVKPLNARYRELLSQQKQSLKADEKRAESPLINLSILNTDSSKNATAQQKIINALDPAERDELQSFVNSSSI